MQIANASRNISAASARRPVSSRTQTTFKSLRLEPSRSKLAGKSHRSVQIALHHVEVALLITREYAHGLAQQFGARLSNKRGGAGSSVPILFCLRDLGSIMRLNPTIERLATSMRPIRTAGLALHSG